MSPTAKSRSPGSFITMTTEELSGCPAPYNPRTIDPAELEALQRSIQEFGLVEPVVWNVQSGHIVGGHQRVKAAKLAGIGEMAVFVVDLDPTRERQLNLALNRISGTWEPDLLKSVLEELWTEGADLSLTGFTDEELQKWLPEMGRQEGAGDAEAVPDLEKVAVSRLRDLWQLGPHRLVVGDARDEGVFEQLLDGHKVDAIITDPPYNVGYEGKTSSRLTIQNDKQDDGTFRAFLDAAYTRMFEVAKAGAALYVFHADTEGHNFRAAMSASGWKLAQCCIWVKQSMVLGRQDYHWQHEPVLYGWKPRGKHRWYTDRKQTTVWHFNRPQRSEAHPTMKPVDLLEYLLHNSTRQGDLVLDPFSGSGSTLIACQIRGRAARAIELDPLYADVILRRWQEYTGEMATCDGESFAEREAQAGN